MLTSKAMASTIIPVISEALRIDHSPISSTLIHNPVEVPEELLIPLPPSRPSSENSLRAEPTKDDESSSALGDLVRPPYHGLQGLPSSEPITVVGDETDNAGSRTPDEDPKSSEYAIPSTACNPPFSLDELAQLIRKDRYTKHHAHSIQCQTQDLLVYCGLRSRLAMTQSQLYGRLADYFRTGNLAAFESLFYIGKESQDYCNIAIEDTATVDILSPSEPLGPDLRYSSHSWIHTLSEGTQQDIIRLLNKIRTEPAFLASRISSLSSEQLMTLALPSQSSGNADSVIHGHVYPGKQMYNKHSKSTASPASAHQYLGIDDRDPLFLLLFAVFDVKSEPGCQEYLRRTDIWSTICAQVITDGKRGSDDFAIAVLDAFANLHPWPLRHQLEIDLMKLVEEGSFLVDPLPPQPIDFTQPTELQNAKAAVAVSEFFDNALKTLFNLITQGPPHLGIPNGMLDFVRAILSKIQDPKKRIKARSFMLSRWYCTSFLSHALIYPESRGLMMKHHISGAVRQKILREVAIRMQKQIVDVMSPWKDATLVVPDLEASVNRLIQLFEPAAVPHLATRDSAALLNTDVKHLFLTLSPQDVVTIIKGLFPERSLTADFDNLILDSAYSSASSATGSSTLTAADNETRTGTASSTTPSVSGSSLTSNTTSGESPLDGFPPKIHSSHSQRTIYEDHSKDRIRDVEENYRNRMKGVIDDLMRIGGVKHSFSEGSRLFVGHQWATFFIQAAGQDLSLTPFEINLRSIEANSDAERQQGYQAEALTFHGAKYQNLSMAITRIVDDDDHMPIPGLAYSSTAVRENSGAGDIRAILESRFHSMVIRCQLRYDFRSAHFWWKNMQTLRDLSLQACESFLGDLVKKLNDSIEIDARTSGKYEEWHYSLQIFQRTQDSAIQDLQNERKALRDKMWYVSQVRHSSTYEDALNVARALRAMARPTAPKQSGVGAWARHRLRTSIGQNRAQAQTLEAIAAPNEHGGPSKLAEEQVGLTSRWLTRHSIENFCKGEERIHRFCFEVRKCVNGLVGESLLDSPVLWSSSLYRLEKQEFDSRSRQSEGRRTQGDLSQGFSTSVSPGLTTSPTLPSTRFETPESTFGNDGLPSRWGQFSQPWLGQPGHPNSPSRLWHLNPASLPPMGAVLTGPQLPSSGHSTLLHIGGKGRRLSKATFMSQLKQSLTSLLLSDLGSMGWNQGSETDRWVADDKVQMATYVNESWSAVSTQPHTRERRNLASDATDPGNASTSPGMRTSTDGMIHDDPQTGITQSAVHSDRGLELRDPTSLFPYTEAYQKLLEKFSLSLDPHVKLLTLYELTLLAASSNEESSAKVHIIEDSALSDTETISNSQQASWTRKIGVPRTRATRLEEVMANCEERRASTMLQGKSNQSSLEHRSYPFNTPITDSKLRFDPHDGNHVVAVLHSIFRDCSLRPKTLFRDLQYIAAFVPSSILDTTPEGKAFWDTGLAALSLKADLCKTMIARANEIVTYHLADSGIAKKANNAAGADGKLAAEGTANREPTSLEHSSLAEAARLYLVTAQEGDPTAARELALFYLTHPELIPRATLALSRPSEIFKTRPATVGSDRSGEGKQREGGLDPLTFAVAFHWMEFAANGGDKDARAFLKQNGELGRGW